MPQTIPQYLYKYRTVDANSLALLASDKVYLSRLDAFNDPFEMLSFESTLETKLSVDKHGTFAISKEAPQLAPFGTSLRVCSLSEEYQDLLMWGHYADCHRGFCIRFEFASDPTLSQLIFPIKYADAYSDENTASASPREKALHNTLAKSAKWSYEREWRIIGQIPAGESQAAELFAAYRPEAVTGIIFGVRMPALHKTLIKKILQKHKLEFLQAEKHQHDFALTIRPATVH
jgi:Protein of unknown function (DUF2971)